MSTAFDKREEHFVALVAKAGCSLAQVSSHHHAAPKASTTAKGSPIISDGDENDENNNGDDTSSSASTRTDADTLMTDMEHVQVASMLLGQASDHLDAMEVEWRLVTRALSRSSRSTRRSGQAVASELRHRLDGCSDMCNALRAECRAVRARLRDADSENEATEEVRFEKEGAAHNGSANDNGARTKKSKKVKQWTCDVCKVAKFTNYDEACRHEETCDGRAKASPPDEDELSYKQQQQSKGRGSGGTTTPKGRSSAANAYRSSLFDKAERATATLASQNATLDHARRVMADTEATAGTVTEELARNRETIESAHGRVGELHGMTNNARRTIQTMQRRKKYLF